MRNDDYVCQELPDHLIYDIFLNLPASTLMRFRTLSKEWCKIFSSHHFLIHYSNRRRPKDICIHFLCKRGNEGLEFTITPNMMASWSEDARNNRPISLPHPVRFPIPIDFGIRTCLHISRSSCHGMLCLKLFHSNDDNYESIIVWNPVTSQLRHVPCPPEGQPRVCSSFIGFGYDDVIDDYKILTRSAGIPRITSLKSGYGIWRKIDTPFWGCCFSTPVTLGGDIYWISYIQGKHIIKDNYWASQNLSEIGWYYVVLKFNVTNESLTVLPSPFKTVGSNLRILELSQYRGSLCFFSVHGGITFSGHWANIWTLHQDKNGEPVWNSLMDVPYLPFLKYHVKSRHCRFEFTASGDLIICTAAYGLLVYLAQEKRYLEVPLHSHHPLHNRLLRAEDFYFLENESLASPFGTEH